MRDIALTVFIFGLIPFIFRRPWLGVLLWTWIGLMNPHKLTWGFAFDFQFAQLIGAVTLVSFLFSNEPKRLPMTSAVLILIAFVIWMNVTTLFAINPEEAWRQWEKVMKIQLIIFVTILMLQTKERIRFLVWVIVISIGFYGVKGGLFTLRGGGGGMVLGPPGGFIEGNTTIALAIIMVMPLMVYLMLHEERKWVRWALGISIVLCAVAAIGTYSRGALLAIVAMGAWLWLKGSRKLLITALLVLVAPVIFYVMPDAWFERMNSITAYERDSSAMGRLNAWRFAINLANDRPITGGGFESFSREAFQRWAPNPLDFHDSHSIWFQVLGHHGYVGLTLFVLLWIASWRLAGRMIALSRRHPSLRWGGELAAMVQVSMVGFWTGASFLGLAYFDLPYILIALLVLAMTVMKREWRANPASAVRSQNTAFGHETRPASMGILPGKETGGA